MYLNSKVMEQIVREAVEFRNARLGLKGSMKCKVGLTDEEKALTQRLLAELDEIETLQAVKEIAVQDVQETTVEVLLDSVAFACKPEGRTIGTLTKRLPRCKQTVTLEDLSYFVSSGRSWKASVMSDTSNASYVSSSLVALDIDNKESYVSVEEFMSLEHKYQPCFIYETFSSVSEHERFRVVYAFDSVITDYDTMCALYKEVWAQYPGVDIDASVDPGKILFGGKKLRHFNNVVNETPVVDVFEKEVSEYTSSHSISENDRDVICENLKAMKKTYGNRIVKNSYEINDIIGRIPLNVVLGLNVSVGAKFNCILDGHTDDNASANIYLTKNGYYMYKCFGCDSSLYLTDFIDKETICKILNIRTMWYENNKDMLDHNRKVIDNPEVMVGEYHNVYKKVVAYYKLSSVLLDLAEEQLERLGRTFTTDKVDNVIISERYAEIGKRIAEKFLTVKGDRKNVQNQLDILMLMRFVIKLTDEELAQLNPVMLRRNKRNVKSFDPKYNTQYGIMINKWNMITLTDAENMLVYYKELGATTLGASQRQSVELGCDTRSKNNKSNDTEVLVEIKQCLVDYYDECVNTKGYVLKDEFMAYAKANNTGRRLASTFIAMLNKQYGLTSAIVNKDLIAKHEELSAADSKKRIFLAAA